MPRGAIVGLAAVTVTAAGAFLAFATFSADPGAGHRPGHIGCPPGSHGKPWSAGVGRSLASALSRRAVPAAADAPAPLADRALTASMPSR